MRRFARTLFFLGASVFSLGIATPQMAKAYEVDCAILLCLSGGWPASAPCAHARAVFIQRITPWPIEPPLQIWRCPMGASFEVPSDQRGWAHLLEAAYSSRTPQLMSRPDNGWLLEAQSGDQATVDISGPEFDFVRSIRVYDIQFRQRENSDGDCNRSDATRIGSYGVQGDYWWTRTSVSVVPAASDFDPPNGCSDYRYRAVFVDWRDYFGNYGSEEVPY